MSKLANVTEIGNYSVIYRTGGKVNFKWHRVFDRFDREQAISKKQELERAGYPAMYVLTLELDAIGLPETFSSGCGSIDWEA